jgi:hypothetical protein
MQKHPPPAFRLRLVQLSDLKAEVEPAVFLSTNLKAGCTLFSQLF